MFLFPEIVYDDNLHIKISCLAGYIRWGNLYDIYHKGKELKSNLRKAPKLSYLALHPGNSKQNVPLALAVIHETTITAARIFIPNQRDVANFLEFFNTWWTVSNSNKIFSPNILGNAVINADRKTEFLRALADWIEQWCQSPTFTLTPQTASALTTTLRSHAMLIDNLLNETYQYVITARLQNDPVE